MPLVDLDHYFVRVRDLERSRRFYCDVLGLEVMPRPDFPFPGYWLGVGGKVQVHMAADSIHAQGTRASGTPPRPVPQRGPGLARRATRRTLSPASPGSWWRT